LLSFIMTSECNYILGDKVISAVSTTLTPSLAKLRDDVLKMHQGPQPSMVENIYSDARSWAAHSADEDWLLWRGRRTFERLRNMTVSANADELIVGLPAFRHPTENDQIFIEEAKTILATMPPFPGGDTGHFHPDYEKLFSIGIRGIRQQIEEFRKINTDTESQNFYDSCNLAIYGLTSYIKKTVIICRENAEAGKDGNWGELADICEWVASEPPRTFKEAIQLMFFATIALWIGEDHYLTTPGRIDQTLWRFYAADIKADRITPQVALDLICALYINLNRLLWPGSAVSVIVGGRDTDGNAVVNDLTYLALAARRLTHLVYPTVAIAWHTETPDELMNYGCEILASGIGDPAFFNDEIIAQGLRTHGVSVPDSYNYMNSTCVEIKVCGASNMWVASPYFNCPQSLLDVMAQIAGNEIREPKDFSELSEKVRVNLAAKVEKAAQDYDDQWKLRADRACFPLASCFISDCLATGRDFDRGGARYNWVENSFVGLANLADSMMAIKELVYEKKEMSITDFYEILKADFADNEVLRKRIRGRLPAYGNDDDRVDALANEWATFIMDTSESQIVGGHPYVPGFFCWVMHGVLGSQTMATPDGRYAGQPLADGAGAAQGRELVGPTASVLSSTKWCQQRALGGAVHNAKFPKTLVKTAHGRTALKNVITTFLQRGGFEIQVNVVDADVLRKAQAHPEEYADLVVRVAGYSDYFIHLSKIMQDEVITRTEHEL
jgi:pyruvate-formate lyase